MQTSILFYDKKSEAACFDICNHLKIDNMPAYDGKYYYQYIDQKKFRKRSMLKKHIAGINMLLFEEKLINQFAANYHNVMFVFQEDILKGIVHICDYNRDVVLQAIQDDILYFERKLRHFIILNNKKNQDMYEYFQNKLGKENNANSQAMYRRKIEDFERKIKELDSLGDFQFFELSDILFFAASSFSGNLFKIPEYKIGGVKQDGIKIMLNLRNMAMHGKDPIRIDRSSSIYSLDSLRTLIQSLAVLRKETARLTSCIVNNKDYRASVIYENRSKLDIIHEYHPKALDYFIGY